MTRLHFQLVPWYLFVSIHLVISELLLIYWEKYYVLYTFFTFFLKETILTPGTAKHQNHPLPKTSPHISSWMKFSKPQKRMKLLIWIWNMKNHLTEKHADVVISANLLRSEEVAYVSMMWINLIFDFVHPNICILQVSSKQQNCKKYYLCQIWKAIWIDDINK